MTHLMKGPIISSQEVTINSETTGKSLIEKMSQDSCSLLYNTLKEYLSGKANLTDQDHSKSTYAAKIKKSENQINWSLTNIELELKIRAFYPYPAMWFSHKGVRYKVLKVKLSKVDGPPGLIVGHPSDNSLSKRQHRNIRNSTGRKKIYVNRSI
jgi:methionyl-tRNA formyltransferase